MDILYLYLYLYLRFVLCTCRLCTLLSLETNGGGVLIYCFRK